MSKFLCYSFLVLLSLTIWRSPVVSAWAPSRTTTTTTTSRSQSRLLVVTAPLQRRQAVASYLSGTPSISTSTHDRVTFSSTLLHVRLHHHSADSSDAESNDTDHSRRRFLVQSTLRAAAAITTTLLTTTTPTAQAATPTATDETIKHQSSSSSSSSSSKTAPDPSATPPKWPESESPLPSPWTNMSLPSFSEDDSSNGGAAEGATTDFSRAMQKAGKQKNIDPRTHG
jgi:hypothetical protein